MDSGDAYLGGRSSFQLASHAEDLVKNVKVEGNLTNCNRKIIKFKILGKGRKDRSRIKTPDFTEK